MKKITAVAFMMFVLAGSAVRAGAAGTNSAGLGFDMTGSFYLPSDSRYSGIGSGVNVTLKMDENLTMGYRIEELNVRGEASVAGVKVTDNVNVMFQGINAFYRTYTSDKVTADIGLWMGSAVTSCIGLLAATPAQQSVMLEPQGRLVYSTAGKVDSRITVGVGYRFVPGFNTLTPFGGASKELSDFNGITLSLGVGLGF